MIIKTDEQTELQFGKGDICVTGGCYYDIDNNKVGLVAFINQEPHEIGLEGIIKGGKEYCLEDFPLIMTFEKSESIDAVIEQLLSAKKEMNKTNADCKTCQNGYLVDGEWLCIGYNTPELCEEYMCENIT